MNLDDQFVYFYELYGLKKGKVDAQRAWGRLSLKDRRLACAGLKDRVEHDRQWLAGYKPHPATYLNRRRWEDHWERHVPRSQRPDNVRDTTTNDSICPDCRSHLSSDWHQRECKQAEQLMDNQER